MAGELRILSGARATEAAVLDAAAAEMAAVRAGARRLGQPLRIVVPSHSLRVHLGSALAARCGAVAGIRVQTLRGLACEVLERSGRAVRPGDAWLPVLVRRLAAAQPALGRALGPLRDGYGPVVASVADLLDAGLEPALADGLQEAIDATGSGPRVRERAAAVLAVALAAQAELGRLGLLHRSGLLSAAREALEADPAWLPTRGLWVHGFADVTGVAGDLLEALRRAFPSRIFVDRPPAPSPASAGGAAFVERFLSRMAPGAGAQPEGPAPDPPRLRLLRAPGADAELRGVAQRVRALLDGGARPEGIAIVARDLGPYRVPLRRQLGRLAVPFSAGAAVVAPAGAAARGIEGLLELLRDPARLPAERWLDVRAAGAAPTGAAFREAADLRVAFHAAGVGRLAEVARLDCTRWVEADGSLRLPVRTGLRGVEGRGATRRRIPGRLVERTVERARVLLGALEGWPVRAPFSAHRRALARLLGDELGWKRGGALRRGVDGVLATLAAELPAACELSRDELVTLLEKPLRGVGAGPLGGAGGGVAVLSVMEARARSFDHLFLVGVNRERFPRPVQEDALLPDRLRGELAASTLPDVPIKERGFDEERYLFAQLLSASPEVTLSWQFAGEDGRTLNRSPFVEGLRLGRDLEVESLPAALGARLPEAGEARASALLRPAHEHAVLAGLHGSRARYRALLGLALEGTGPGAADLARVRSAVLAEHERAPREPQLGPYLGWVGRAQGAEGFAAKTPWITQLEAVARCPWQGFLRRVLGVEPLPDVFDSLPEVDGRLIGATTHAVLEHITGSGERELLADVLGRPARPLRWPGSAALVALCREQAARALEEEGLPGGGFLEWLAGAVHARVQRAEVLLAASPGALLGAEVEGEVAVPAPSGEVAVRFRADLVESTPSGVRLTDFKAGRADRSESDAAGRKRFERAVAAGERLQAVAYALAVGGEGRYLQLDPGLAGSEGLGPAVASDDEALTARFAATLEVLVEALRSGQLPPRLVDAKHETPRHCEHCEVASACLRGDSGARHRLTEWAAQAQPGGADAPARAVWALGGSR